MKVKTAQEMEEERLRTLYIRLPHTIKNIDEIREIVFGEATIKLPRQSGRYCHVVFPSLEEKVKNMKALKKKLMDNKRIFVKPLKMKNPDAKNSDKQTTSKKIKSIEIIKPKPKEHVSKICFIHNIPKSATVKDLKPLFPGAKNVAILWKQRLTNEPRTGIVKFRSIDVASAFLNKETPWPVCKGVQLELRRDTRKQKKGRKSKEDKNTDEIKIEEDIKSESDDDVEDDQDDEEGDEDEDDIKSENEEAEDEKDD